MLYRILTFFILIISNLHAENLKNCDAYVVNQGEKGYYEIIKRFRELNLDINNFLKNDIPESLINNFKNKKINIKNCKNEVHIGKNIGTLDDLNEI